MSYARRILFGMAASTAAVATIYVGGMLVSGLTRAYAIYRAGDTFFVEVHWHAWAIVSIALLSFALGFSRTPRTR